MPAPILPTPIKPISIKNSSSGERFLQTGIIVSVSALRVKVRQYSKNLYAERGEAADGSRSSHLDGMAVDAWLPAARGMRCSICIGMAVLCWDMRQ
jgi:hypothetical protein